MKKLKLGIVAMVVLLVWAGEAGAALIDQPIPRI